MYGKTPPHVTHKLACYQIDWVWTYCSFSSSLSLSHCFTSGSIHGGVYDLDQPPPLYVTCSFLNLNWEMIYSTHLLRCVNINHQSHFVDNSTLQMFTYLFELTLAHVTGTPLLIRISNTSNTVTVIVTNNAIYWCPPPPWRGVVLIPVNIPMLSSFSIPIGQYTDIVVLFHTYRSIYRYCRHFPCSSVNIPILLSFSMLSVNIPILLSFPCHRSIYRYCRPFHVYRLIYIPISHHSIYQSILVILGECNLLYTIFYYTHSGIKQFVYQIVWHFIEMGTVLQYAQENLLNQVKF